MPDTVITQQGATAQQEQHWHEARERREVAAAEAASARQARKEEQRQRIGQAEAARQAEWVQARRDIERSLADARTMLQVISRGPDALDDLGDESKRILRAEAYRLAAANLVEQAQEKLDAHNRQRTVR